MYKDKVIPFIPEGDFYFTKGVEAFQKRKFELAIKWLKKAIEQTPKEALYQCQLSIVYTEIGQFHKANQLLTEVVSEHGEHYIDCYYLIANNYAHLGLFQDAKRFAETYLEKNVDGEFKEEAETLLDLMDLDEEEDDDDWAYEEEDELLIYQETVFYHLEREEWDIALPLLDELMTLFPTHVSAKHEYAFAKFFDGDQGEAFRLEKEWLEENPQSLYGHTNLAIFYYESGQQEMADEHIEVIRNVYPIHEQQKLRIAFTLARTGYCAEAYSRFRALSKSQLQGHVSYYKWYSVAAYHCGEVDKANVLWAEACKRFTFLDKNVKPWNAE
ncbi:hypothetical protein FN924_14240 [Radiobacillus deserti]|uniref:Tetratricopeptide repeat protein n=2 Tax=Radiobacillus deserti TaxID=2594883 RepID=A0A516KLC9_9BACI|nr:hypothetical protein FN924_14240 [Radiobacillus deserti]